MGGVFKSDMFLLSTKIKNYNFLPLIVLGFFYLLLCFIYPFLWHDVLKFILFQVVFILLPGYLFCNLLVSKNLSIIEKCILGYPVSIVIIFLLSWIGKIIDVNSLIYIVPAISIVSIIIILKDNKKEKILLPANYSILISILYTVCAGFFFFLFTISVGPPGDKYYGLYYQDSLWTIGNTWSYIRAFPLLDPRMDGVDLVYHILQNIYQAAIYQSSGIDPFNIHLYLEPLFDWFLLISAIIISCYRILKLSFKETIITAFLILFCSEPTFLLGAFTGHLYHNPLSMFFGLPVFIIFIFSIISYLSGRDTLKVIYLSVLFIFISATKAHLLIVIPLSLFVMFIYNALKKQVIIKELLLGLLLLAGIFILRFTIYNGESGRLHFNIYDYKLFLAKNEYLYIFFNNVSQYLGDNFSQIIFNIAKQNQRYSNRIITFLSQPMMALFLLIIILSREFRNQNKDFFKSSYIFSGAFILISLMLVTLFNFSGGKAYFFWYSRIIALPLIAIFIDYLTVQKKITYTIIAIFLLCYGVYFHLDKCKKWMINPWWNPPFRKSQIWDMRATIDKYEFEAMTWLKENTDIKATFFSDRMEFLHEKRMILVPRFYGYSALSGRQSFVEGNFYTFGELAKLFNYRWALVEKFVKSNNNDNAKLLNEIKAEYFIQSKRFNHNDYSKFNGFRLVFSNPSINIYKIVLDK